jgi:hypothetical protein
MRKLMLIASLGVVAGWFGFVQFQQAQTDRAAVSVSRNVAQAALTLPTLSTAAPAFDPMALAAADTEQKHSVIRH